MLLLSVNIGFARQVGPVVSGIYKTPVKDAVYLGENGLESDAVCDKRFHGGLDQAVYVYTGDDYAWWSEQLGTEIDAGTFGDNLTISGLSSRDVNVEDRFQIGTMVIEATAPRIPCATLGRRMEDSHFPIAFRHAERSGFYCRVINPGLVQTGQSIKFQESASDNPVSILELFKLYYEANPSIDQLRRALNAKIAHRERDRLMEKLANRD